MNVAKTHMAAVKNVTACQEVTTVHAMMAITWLQITTLAVTLMNALKELMTALGTSSV